MAKEKDLQSQGRIVGMIKQGSLGTYGSPSYGSVSYGGGFDSPDIIQQNLKSRGSIGAAVTYRKDLKSQGNINKREYQDLKSKGDIKIPAITYRKDLKSRGSISRKTYQDLKSRANLVLTQFGDLSSKADIKVAIIYRKDLKSKASIAVEVKKDLKAKADLFNRRSQDLKTEGNIGNTAYQDLKSKGQIQVIAQEDLRSRGSIRVPEIEQVLETQANIKVISQSDLSTRASLYHIAPTALVSPMDEAVETSPVILVWEIPSDSLNRNIHAHVQVDKTDNTFQDLEAEKLSYRDSGFEYWDGDSWEPYPAEGVGSAYYGNQARVQIILTGGIKFWRVKGCT